MLDIPEDSLGWENVGKMWARIRMDSSPCDSRSPLLEHHRRRQPSPESPVWSMVSEDRLVSTWLKDLSLREISRSLVRWSELTLCRVCCASPARAPRCLRSLTGAPWASDPTTVTSGPNSQTLDLSRRVSFVESPPASARSPLALGHGRNCRQRLNSGDTDVGFDDAMEMSTDLERRLDSFDEAT